jgi:hypothetical protein
MAGMKCDSCGHEFPPWETVQDTRDEQTGTANVLGANTETVPFTICPVCASNREANRKSILWGVVILIAGMLLTLFILGQLGFR